jgi:hypothetical protein
MSLTLTSLLILFLNNHQYLISFPHRVHHSSCKAKVLAEEKQSKREMTPRKGERLESSKKKSLEKKGKKGKGRVRGAQKHSGPGRQ